MRLCLAHVVDFARALLAVGSMAAQVSAQAAIVTISGEPECPECALDFEEVVRLGARQDSSSFTFQSMLGVDQEGNYLVGPLAHPGEIYVYNAAGQYAGRIGREGEGPGEFGAGLLLGSTTNGLHVIDNSRRRYTVLTFSGEPVRMTSVPAFVRDFAILESGELVIEGEVSTPTAFGLPLHLLDRVSGAPRLSFGAESKGLVPPGAHGRMRLLAAGPDTTVWAAHASRYVIEQFGHDGGLRQRVFRDVDWFAPWSEEPPGSYVTRPPPPRVAGLSLRDGRYLMVYLLVPDAHWEAEPASQALTPRSIAAQFDSVIEILDPQTSSVLGSMRFDSWVRPTLDGALAYSVIEDDQGYTRIVVWRPTWRDSRAR